MKTSFFLLSLTLAGAAMAQPAATQKQVQKPASASDQPITTLPEIIVTGTRLPAGAPLSAESVDITGARARGTDGAS
uniref:hypothetical protein n=1 Tax=Prosthecobacter sp. TaxID=1965333 RepID=UPI0037CA1306